jgi:tetratricopeptide (TPR) repeat protein
MPSPERSRRYAVRRRRLDTARDAVQDKWIGPSVASTAAIFSAISVILAALNTDRLTSIAPWVVVALVGLVSIVLWFFYLILRFIPLVVFVALASVLVLGSAGAATVLGVSKIQESLTCDRAKAHIESGKNFADARTENRAVSEFSAAMGACVDGIAYLYRGQALSAMGRDTVAIDDLNSALQLLPAGDISSVREVYLKRGQDYLSQGDCDAAVADLKRSRNVDPYFDPAFHNLAIARASQGNLNSQHPDNALQDINRALELNPGQAVYLYARAKIELLLNDVTSAVADLNSTIANSKSGDQDIKFGASKLLDTIVSGRPVGQLFESCRS